MVPDYIGKWFDICNNSYVLVFKGGPEPLEEEIHEILSSKREDWFSALF